MSEHENNNQAAVEDAAEHIAGDVKRGARRAKAAIRDTVADGAEALEETARPTFLERLVDGWKSVTDDPSAVLEQGRGIVRDHPVISLVAVAITSAALARMVRR